MQYEEEPQLTENALRALQARYLRKDADGNVIETPREMFLRVAKAVAEAEGNYGARPAEIEEQAQAFYAAMASGEFLPNSPTLMNAGKSIPLLSACFVLPVEDSIEGIFESVKHTAQIQKAGGGTGFSFDRLRPAGDYIASSGGRTSGPISFWRVFSEATRAIQQGAFRRGANMGMMSLEHPDILKFVLAKNDLSAFENFNISVKVTDVFMESLRLRPDEPHTVSNPHTGRQYHLPRSLDTSHYQIQDLLPATAPPERPVYTRRDLWNLVVKSAWATGEPGLCFIDTVNDDNPTPHIGRIEATNPCGEQPLLDYEACNLGSINLSRFIRNGKLDEKAFRSMIRMGVRFLDDVIDVAGFVIPQIENRCRSNRKIGLGIMGLADALFMMGVKYDSPEGLEAGRHVAEILHDEAFRASEALAAVRGSFPNWHGSVWDIRHHRPMRNAAVTTIAPTGTVSLLAGCSGGIEPVFALAFYRHVLEGQEMLEVCAPFRQYAETEGFWSEDLAKQVAAGAKLSAVPGLPPGADELFVTAYEIAPAWHVRMQAVFQEFIDGAISKTINLPNGATVEDVEQVYQMAFDLKCKGVTIYRDGCRSGQPMILKKPAALCPQCHGDLAEEVGCSRCPHCGTTLCSL